MGRAETLTEALDAAAGARSDAGYSHLLQEKDPVEMLTALDARAAALLVLCAPPSPRARDPREVAAAARTLGVADDRVLVVDDVAAAVDRAVGASPESGQVVVTGSLYVVGAARAALGIA